MSHDESTDFQGCGPLLFGMLLFWVGMVYAFFTMTGVE